LQHIHSKRRRRIDVKKCTAAIEGGIDAMQRGPAAWRCAEGGKAGKTFQQEVENILPVVLGEHHHHRIWLCLRAPLESKRVGHAHWVDFVRRIGGVGQCQYLPPPMLVQTAMAEAHKHIAAKYHSLRRNVHSLRVSIRIVCIDPVPRSTKHCIVQRLC
jgi:hypothetical protein